MLDKIENHCQHATQRLLSNIIPSAEAKIKGKRIPEEHLVKKVKRMQKDEVRAKKLVVEDRTWRINWLNLSWRRCQFCGKGTSRCAVFHFMTWCCHKCDTALWPKKVSTCPSPVCTLP
jgi:Fe-S-cluster containining protein